MSNCPKGLQLHPELNVNCAGIPDGFVASSNDEHIEPESGETSRVPLRRRSASHGLRVDFLR